MIKMSDIRKKTDKELVELVQSSREAVREEFFKEKFSRKTDVVRGNKKNVARALTELSARRQNKDAK